MDEKCPKRYENANKCAGTLEINACVGQENCQKKENKQPQHGEARRDDGAEQRVPPIAGIATISETNKRKDGDSS